MAQRSFQKRAQYQEGRKEQEAAWKNAEVDALYLPPACTCPSLTGISTTR